MRFAPLLLALALVGACDDHPDASAACAGPDSDLEFIDAMVPHHAMAVDMSEMVLQRGSSGELKVMARHMRDAQKAEIAAMKAVRVELVGSDEVAAQHDPHMHADLEKMAAASGAALDRLFVEEMLPHHAGAITMSHLALPFLERAELRALARTITLVQAREIGELGAMLEE